MNSVSNLLYSSRLRLSIVFHGRYFTYCHGFSQALLLPAIAPGTIAPGNAPYGSHIQGLLTMGEARIRPKNGRIARAEIHSYEAHGIVRKEFKRKRHFDKNLCMKPKRLNRDLLFASKTRVMPSLWNATKYISRAPGSGSRKGRRHQDH